MKCKYTRKCPIVQCDVCGALAHYGVQTMEEMYTLANTKITMPGRWRYYCEEHKPPE
jgi:hypothetical protein